MMIFMKKQNHPAVFTGKTSLAEEIENKRVSPGELKRILSDFEKHLRLPHGTLQNYPKRRLIQLAAEHYPELVSLDELQEYTQQKVNFLAGKLYLCACENKPINISAQLFKMLTDYLKGREESEDGGRAYIVNNFFQPSERGCAPAPEAKEADFPESSPGVFELNASQ